MSCKHRRPEGHETFTPPGFFTYFPFQENDLDFKKYIEQMNATKLMIQVLIS